MTTFEVGQEVYHHAGYARGDRIYTAVAEIKGSKVACADGTQWAAVSRRPWRRPEARDWLSVSRPGEREEYERAMAEERRRNDVRGEFLELLAQAERFSVEKMEQLNAVMRELLGGATTDA